MTFMNFWKISRVYIYIYTFLPGRDISWHMLGKFQEISGNFKTALYAYRKSLDETGINRISTATEERIKKPNACV